MNRATIGTLERGLYAGAALLLGWCALVLAEGCWSQASLGARLAELSGAGGGHGARAVATRREAHRSGLVGRIVIPRLALSAVIVEGTSSARLRRGVGHLEGTAFPGERGNAVLAAHRDTYFRRLRDVAVGDRVIVTTPDGVFRYRVAFTRVVTPEQTDLIAATRASTLTLVTCWPFHWIGPAPDRFVVRLAAESPARSSPRVVRGPTDIATRRPRDSAAFVRRRGRTRGGPAADGVG